MIDEKMLERKEIRIRVLFFHSYIIIDFSNMFNAFTFLGHDKLKTIIFKRSNLAIHSYSLLERECEVSITLSISLPDLQHSLPESLKSPTFFRA